MAHIEGCEKLINTESKNVKEHKFKVNKIMNELYPCRQLQQTNATSIRNHKFQLDKLKEEEKEEVEEETIWDKIISIFRF